MDILRYVEFPAMGNFPSSCQNMCLPASNFDESMKIGIQVYFQVINKSRIGRQPKNEFSFYMFFAFHPKDINKKIGSFEKKALG